MAADHDAAKHSHRTNNAAATDGSRRLSRAFNLKSIVLAAGLAIGGGEVFAQGVRGGQDAQHRPMLSAANKKKQPPTILTGQKEQPLIADSNSAAALNALKSEFGRTPLGQELLAFAASQNITIRFDASIAATNNFAQYLPENATVSVRPDLALEEQVLYLAHELRHGWQDKTLGYSALNANRLTPEQRFTLQRFVEADAHAFSALFWADRMQRLGIASVAQYANFELGLAKQLLAKMDSGGNIPLADYGSIALVPYFDNLENYNSRHVAMVGRATDVFRAEVRAATESGLAGRFTRLAADIAAAPDDAAFAAWLRQLGGTDLSVTGETALAQATVETLLQDYALRGLDSGTLMPRLGSASIVMPPPKERLERLQSLDAKQRDIVKGFGIN